MENNCLFCKIADKIISVAEIYEDSTALGFLDINPIAPGHTLVIPKIHAENILDLMDNQIGILFKAVQNTTSLLQRKLNPQGFTIGINHGKMGGQMIDHLHIHIIPRFEGDGGGSLHAVVKNPPSAGLEVIQNKILN